MVTAYAPTRGDIVWLNFTPQRGREQAGVRPALVISPQRYNQKSGLMLTCPITSKIKGYPFEVVIRTHKINGAILADQLKSVDWAARKVSFVEHVPEPTLHQAQELIKILVVG